MDWDELRKLTAFLRGRMLGCDACEQSMMCDDIAAILERLADGALMMDVCQRQPFGRRVGGWIAIDAYRNAVMGEVSHG